MDMGMGFPMGMGIDDRIGNGNGKKWDPMGMGIGYIIGNGNEKEWELAVWEWEGMEM